MADQPYLTSSNPLLDRPFLALSNMLEGNIGGAANSLVDPESLSLAEREKLGQRLGLEGPLASLVNITTNPVVLGGLALSLMFEAPNPATLSKLTGSIKGKIGPLRFMTSILDQVRGTKVAGLLQEITNTIFATHKPIHSAMTNSLLKFEKNVGRVISQDELRLLVENRDDTLNPLSTSWSRIFGRMEKDGKGDWAEAFRKDLGAAHSRHLAEWEGSVPQLKELAEDIRAIQQQAFKDHLSDPSDAADLLKRFYGSEGTNTSVRRLQKALEEGELGGFKIKELDKYWHRTALQPYEHDLDDAMREAYRQFGPPKYRTDLGREGRESFKGSLERMGAMMPDPQYLLGRGINPRLLNEVAKYSAVTDKGQHLYYNMDFLTGWRKWLQGIAVSKGFAVRPMTTAGVRATQSMGDALKAELLHQYNTTNKAGQVVVERIREVVIPQMMGGMSHNQVNAANAWAGTKSAMIEWMDQPYVAGAIDKLGARRGVDSIKKWLTTDPSSSWPGLGSSISQYFMASTIGLPNIISPLKNSLQTVANVFPKSPAAFQQAMREQAGKVHSYVNHRVAGKTVEEALELTDPDFAKHFLQLDPMAKEVEKSILEGGLDKLILGNKGARVARNVHDKMLSLFSATELNNRMLSFNAEKITAAKFLKGQRWHFPTDDTPVVLSHDPKDPLLKKAVSDYAAEQTWATMFGSGPLHQPSGTLEWWSPIRQFTTFPLRQAGLVLDRMTEHPGYLGRAMLTSGLLYGGAKEIAGSDVSEVLFTGGFPSPKETGPFAPVPVSPLLQVLGASVMAGASGDPEQLQKSLPLLIPGGVGLSRMLPSLPGVGAPAGKLFNRSYADYDSRNEAGMVPVRTADGALIGYYSDAQLAAKSLGIGDIAGEQELALTQTLLKQRDIARNLKQQYMDALYQNDPTSMSSIQQRWKVKFPHTDIPIDRKDVKALQMRREVTRVERLLESMPPELRPDMTRVVATAIGANYPEFLGLQEPGLFGGPTAQAREPYRMYAREKYQSLGDGSLHGVGLQEKMKRSADTITRGGSAGNENSAVGVPVYEAP